jgi:hypothetical protein
VGCAFTAGAVEMNNRAKVGHDVQILDVAVVDYDRARAIRENYILSRVHFKSLAGGISTNALWLSGPFRGPDKTGAKTLENWRTIP